MFLSIIIVYYNILSHMFVAVHELAKETLNLKFKKKNLMN